MKRFLMLVGVAVVAAAMYVAASPASQQSKGPTAKQFNALKKQVASLSKSVKTLQTEAKDVATIIVGCWFTQSGTSIVATGLPVSQFGSSTDGFAFGPPPSGPFTTRTALDVTSGSPTYYLQEVNSACVTPSGLRHGAALRNSTLLQHWLAQHSH